MEHIPALEVVRFAQYFLSTVIKSHPLQGLAHQCAPIDFSVVKYSFSFLTLEYNGLYN